MKSRLHFVYHVGSRELYKVSQKYLSLFHPTVARRFPMLPSASNASRRLLGAMQITCEGGREGGPILTYLDLWMACPAEGGSSWMLLNG